MFSIKFKATEKEAFLWETYAQLLLLDSELLKISKKYYGQDYDLDHFKTQLNAEKDKLSRILNGPKQ